MTDVMATLRQYQHLFEMMGLLSIVLFVGTILIFPVVIIFLPRDYFVRADREPAHQKRQHPLVWWTLTVLKNIVGFVLVLAGLAMLVLPGQGLLTILLGVTLMDFPGKYTLERKLVGKASIARALNRIRRNAGRPSLVLPEPSNDSGTPS
jgi:hypothetical protein